MLGEIRDEYDIEEDVCKKTNANNYLISGKVEISHINEEFDLDIPEGDYATIAGFITSETGRIPQKGETLKIKHFNFLIIRADRTKIDLIRMWTEEDS